MPVSDCTTQWIAVCRALDCVSESCKPAVYHRQNCNRQNAEEDALSVAEFNITLHHTAVLCIRVYHIDVHRVDCPLGCVLHRCTLYPKNVHSLHFRLGCVSLDALWLTQLYTGFTILQLFRFYPAVCNPILWSLLIVQLFPAPTLSAALLQFSGGKEHTFSFALIGHYIIQRGQYPPCFLPWSSFFPTKKVLWQIMPCVGLAPLLVGQSKEVEEWTSEHGSDGLKQVLSILCHCLCSGLCLCLCLSLYV